MANIIVDQYPMILAWSHMLAYGSLTGDVSTMFRP